MFPYCDDPCPILSLFSFPSVPGPWWAGHRAYQLGIPGPCASQAIKQWLVLYSFSSSSTLLPLCYTLVLILMHPTPLILPIWTTPSFVFKLLHLFNELFSKAAAQGGRTSDVVPLPGLWLLWWPPVLVLLTAVGDSVLSWMELYDILIASAALLSLA